MIRLPISGMRARWRTATGHDDITVADSQADLVGALTCVNRSVEDEAGSLVDGTALPVGDLDLLVVARRSEVRGDSFVAEGTCGRCGAPVDVRFSLAAYAQHHRPRVPRGGIQDGNGWWRWPRHDISVRVPAVADVLAAVAADNPRGELLARCVRGPGTAAAERAAERAMAALGPTLRADVAGTCPECGADVVLDVDARELCLAELRFLAASVYDDVHLIASAYGWTQDVILDLPSARRRRYADLIAGRSEFAMPLEAVPVG
jgi:hypothetical protein